MNISKYISISLLSLLPIGFQAHAATISFYLSQPDSTFNAINYTQITISDSSSGDIDFTVELLAPASTGNGSNSGMKSFSFNYDPSLSVSAQNITDITPLSWSVSESANAGGGLGKFDFELSGKGQSNTTDLLSFSITGVTDDTVYSYAVPSSLNPDATALFASHIAGAGAGAGTTSISASLAAVPLPTPIWLFGSGIVGLIIVARRKPGYINSPHLPAAVSQR